MHAGMAGGAVILLEGDDYTGGCVNLASRLWTRPGRTRSSPARPRGVRARRNARRAGGDDDASPGCHEPVEVVAWVADSAPDSPFVLGAATTLVRACETLEFVA